MRAHSIFCVVQSASDGVQMKGLHPALRQQLNANTLAISLKAVTILVATLVIFHQDLAVIANNALQTEFMSHVLAVPFLFAYLLYRKRKMVRAVVPFETSNQPKHTRHLATLSGILLCVTAMTLYWHGSYTFTPLEYHILTLPIFTAGLTLTLFNPQTLRQLAFPITFLAFLTPPPSEILYGLGSTLSVISSEASNAIVNALGVASTISGEYGNPTIIMTRPDDTTVGFAVDIACSGIYSLIGFLIFAAFIAYIARDKTWKKAVIFLIGLPLIYLLNIIRITIILLIGYHYGEQLALQTFHLMGGFVLLFLGTLVLFSITEKLLKTKTFMKPQPPKPCRRCDLKPQNPPQDFCPNCGRLLRYPKVRLKKQDLAKIAAIAFSIILLLSIQAPVFALTEGPAQITIQTPTGEQGNTQILPQIQNYTLEFVYRDKDFEQIAKQDASLLYAYIPLNKTKEPVWVAIEIASTTSSLHGWETCLITWPQTQGYQPKVRRLDVKLTQILQNPPIIAKYFAFQYTKTNLTQLVLYWYETATFKTNTTAQQKHVKKSLITYPDTPQDITEAENQLLPFATAIANHWRLTKTWTKIALTISLNGPALTAATTALLATIIILNTIEKAKMKKANTNAYKKLSKENKAIIDATHQTKTAPTAVDIAGTYEKLNHKPITRDKLIEKLQQAQETGLIKQEIINAQDEPVLGWKTRLSIPK